MTERWRSAPTVTQPTKKFRWQDAPTVEQSAPVERERESFLQFMGRKFVDEPTEAFESGITDIQKLGNTTPENFPSDALTALGGVGKIAASMFSPVNPPLEAAGEAIKQGTGGFIDTNQGLENLATMGGETLKLSAKGYEQALGIKGLQKPAEEIGRQIGGMAPFVLGGAIAHGIKGAKMTPMERVQPALAKATSEGIPTLDEIYPILVEQYPNVARTVKFKLENNLPLEVGERNVISGLLPEARKQLAERPDPNADINTGAGRSEFDIRHNLEKKPIELPSGELPKAEELSRGLEPLKIEEPKPAEVIPDKPEVTVKDNSDLITPDTEKLVRPVRDALINSGEDPAFVNKLSYTELQKLAEKKGEQISAPKDEANPPKGQDVSPRGETTQRAIDEHIANGSLNPDGTANMDVVKSRALEAQRKVDEAKKATTPETAHAPLTEAKIVEAAKAAPKAGNTLKEQKATLLGELDKARDVVLKSSGVNWEKITERNPDISDAKNAEWKQKGWESILSGDGLKTAKTELRKAGFELDGDRVVTKIPGDGTFYTNLPDLLSKRDLISKKFPETLTPTAREFYLPMKGEFKKTQPWPSTLERSYPAKIPSWAEVASESAKRLKEKGLSPDKPSGNLASGLDPTNLIDPAKARYILEPILNKAISEVNILIEKGKIKVEDFAVEVRKRANMALQYNDAFKSVGTTDKKALFNALRNEKIERAKTVTEKPADVVEKPVEASVIEKPAETKQAIEVPPDAPTSETAVKHQDPMDIIGMSKEEQNKRRGERGEPELGSPQAQANSGRYAKAIDEGRGERLYARESASEAMRSGNLSDADAYGILKAVAEVTKEWREAMKKADEAFKNKDASAGLGFVEQAARLKAEAELLDNGLTSGGSARGRSLQMYQSALSLEDMSLVKLVKEAEERKGRPLTAVETSKYAELSEKYERAQKRIKELDENELHRQDIIEKAVAEQIFARERALSKRSSARAGHADRVKSNREDAKAKLRALGMQVNDITGVTAEASWQIGRLAASYMEGGAVKLSDVVDRVITDVPSLSERDVWRAINAKDPAKIERVKRKLGNTISSVKTEARLMEQIAALENGESLMPTARSVAQTSETIKVLRKRLDELRRESRTSELDGRRLGKIIEKINEAQDLLDSNESYIKADKKQDPALIAEAKAKLRELHSLLNSKEKLKKMNKDLADGNLADYQPKPKRQLTPEMQQAQYDMAKAKRAIEQKIRDEKALTWQQWVGETMDITRTLQASFDLSGTGRQGGVLLYSDMMLNPGKLAFSYAKSLTSLTEEGFRKMDSANLSHPDRKIAELSGLEITEIGWGKQEEQFVNRVLSKAIESLPEGREQESARLAAQPIFASERHMVTWGNEQRLGHFSDFLRRNPNATLGELKQIADLLNIVTGRGNVTKIKAMLPALNKVFWSTRFLVSRAQTPYYLAKNIAKFRSEPRVAKESARMLLSSVGGYASILGMFALAGAKVDLDPDSPTLGQVKMGNMKIDFGLGYLPIVRLGLKVGRVAKRGITGEKQSPYTDDLFAAFGNFLKYKFSPVVTAPVALVSGRDVMNRPVSKGDALINSVTPMSIQDIIEVAKEEPSLLGIAIPATILGEGVNTYPDKKPKKVQWKKAHK